MPSHLASKATVALAGALFCTMAQSAGLTVSPPHVKFEPGQQTAEVRLMNPGAEPVTVQASAQRWTQQADGSEPAGTAADFMLYPKVFAVAPGASQVVRLGRLPGAAASPGEVAYRLVLRELPVERKGGGISVTTRFVLPVWVTPARSRADWGVTDAGPRAAAVSNRGNVHVRLVDVSYAALGADGRVRQEVKVPGWYVLAGAQRTFAAKLPKDFCDGAMKISAVAHAVDESRHAEWPAAQWCGDRGNT